MSHTHDPNGLLDLGLDDFPQGSLFLDWQRIVLETARILAVSALKEPHLALVEGVIADYRQQGPA